ncbi:MAG: membrane protein insertion efficiency factor YidD [Deltaproteobacteria bacterium CG_4_10_14_0_8_um_filter_43_12]|nr:MAG: membrane protein insertion efficiency factor YidD [Deltaproteobacteria bacterium CG_4_10_14_0_8_um_filter_43_12]
MAKIFISAIRFYQAYLSSPFRGACIYSPSCSQYSIEAIEKYGAWKGLQLSISRLWRCRLPYEGGHDPIE